MNGDSVPSRPLSNHRPEENQERRGTLTGQEWTPAPRTTENGRRSGSPTTIERTSPESPGKRKRSSSAEEELSSPDGDADGTSYHTRRRLDSYVGENSRDHSPPDHSQSQHSRMEPSQQRPFPPMDRAEHDRNWSPPDSKEFVRATFESQQREANRMEPSQEHRSPPDGSQMQGTMDPQRYAERSSTTEITRAGVQVDPKKRKRVSFPPHNRILDWPNGFQQFANRTKTGCGTCRRRKKKCDEGKPECASMNRLYPTLILLEAI